MLYPGDVKWKEVVFCSPLPHLKKKIIYAWTGVGRTGWRCHSSVTPLALRAKTCTPHTRVSAGVFRWLNGVDDYFSWRRGMRATFCWFIKEERWLRKIMLFPDVLKAAKDNRRLGFHVKPAFGWQQQFWHQLPPCSKSKLQPTMINSFIFSWSRLSPSLSAWPHGYFTKQ